MQKVVSIPISELHLWTENPRDPVDTTLSDEEIIVRAINDPSNNWNLDKLLSNFGDQYYYNQLPTVVLENNSYVVYDGNRRVALLKCIQSSELFSIATGKFAIFAPSSSMLHQTELPCNLCDKSTALDIVESMHRSSNKWGKLQYEWFLYYHRNQNKGPLMLLNEAVPHLVENEPLLNEEYVEQRLLTNANLNSIGFSIENGELYSNHDPEIALSILEDIADVRRRKISDARHLPGKLKAALEQLNPSRYNDIKTYSSSAKKIALTGEKSVKKAKTNSSSSQSASKRRTQTRKSKLLFNGPLRPKGDYSNTIYLAIEDIYSLYRKNETKYSRLLPILGFSLRLFLDIVAREYYEENDPEQANKDEAYSSFLKEVVKPEIKSNSSLLLKNDYSLIADWINGSVSFEALLGKWAHGSATATLDAIIRCSEIIGFIVRNFWWKD